VISLQFYTQSISRCMIHSFQELPGASFSGFYTVLAIFQIEPLFAHMAIQRNSFWRYPAFF